MTQMNCAKASFIFVQFASHCNVTANAKNLCAAPKFGCQVVGSLDSFADVPQADGRPGRVISANEAKAYHKVHSAVNEHLHKLLGLNSTPSDRKKVANLSSELAMSVV